jgi:hypothetical protein
MYFETASTPKFSVLLKLLICYVLPKKLPAISVSE